MSRSKRDILETERMLERLTMLLNAHRKNALGTIADCRRDAESLRRISMTLRRWFELECGNSNDHGSWAIVRGYKTNKPGYWHQYNPWADRIVYVPLVELAHCAAGGNVTLPNGETVPHDFERVLSHWRQCGREKLDGYILPQPSGDHSLGVRYGKRGEQYYSPHNANPEKRATYWRAIRIGNRSADFCTTMTASRSWNIIITCTAAAKTRFPTFPYPTVKPARASGLPRSWRAILV